MLIADNGAAIADEGPAKTLTQIGPEMMEAGSRQKWKRQPKAANRKSMGCAILTGSGFLQILLGGWLDQQPAEAWKQPKWRPSAASQLLDGQKVAKSTQCLPITYKTASYCSHFLVLLQESGRRIG